MQTAHLQRVNDAHKHGDLNVRKALSSNSLQRFDNSTGNDKSNNNGNGNQNQTGNGKKKGKKNAKSSETNPSNPAPATNSSNTTTAPSTTTSNNSTTGQLDKKLKRRLVMAISCSVCGYEVGHSDLDCFKDPDSDESKKAVVENRKDVRMKDFFRNIDNAKKKRA